jgi:hypothetical protein
MANEYYISAGIIPIDNSTGATANNYYISAGIVPADLPAAGGLSGGISSQGVLARMAALGRSLAGSI